MTKTRYISVSALFVGCVLLGQNVLAQSQKIGYIESDRIIQQMPEYTGIEQQLQVLSDNWEAEIRRMESELDELERDFEAREILFTDEIREQRLAELERKKRELQQYIHDRFGPEGEYFTRQKEFLEPIQRTVFDALYRVADRENFDFVFDRSDDIRFLYAGQEWNLTEDVLIEMGMDGTGN